MNVGLNFLLKMMQDMDHSTFNQGILTEGEGSVQLTSL
jgi:hypothetical protein